MPQGLHLRRRWASRRWSKCLNLWAKRARTARRLGGLTAALRRAAAAMLQCAGPPAWSARHASRSSVRLHAPRSSCRLLGGCGYNQIQQKDEAVKAAWSRGAQPVQAPRRPDARTWSPRSRATPAQEERVLTEVTEARAKVGSINVNADDAGVAGAVPAGAGRTVERAVAPAGGQRELPATSRPTRTSATCRRSWKAPRTASPSRAAATSRRCRTTTPTSASSR